MDACDEKLLRAVERLHVQESSAIECWHLLEQGVRLGWIQIEELQELCEFLSTGRDFGLEELLFSHSGSILHVKLVNNVASCNTQDFLRLLRRLHLFDDQPTDGV